MFGPFMFQTFYNLFFVISFFYIHEISQRKAMIANNKMFRTYKNSLKRGKRNTSGVCLKESCRVRVIDSICLSFEDSFDSPSSSYQSSPGFPRKSLKSFLFSEDTKKLSFNASLLFYIMYNIVLLFNLLITFSPSIYFTFIFPFMVNIYFYLV